MEPSEPRYPFVFAAFFRLENASQAQRTPLPAAWYRRAVDTKRVLQPS